jgi:hypothetical protein
VGIVIPLLIGIGKFIENRHELRVPISQEIEVFNCNDQFPLTCVVTRIMVIENVIGQNAHEHQADQKENRHPESRALLPEGLPIEEDSRRVKECVGEFGLDQRIPSAKPRGVQRGCSKAQRARAVAQRTQAVWELILTSE